MQGVSEKFIGKSTWPFNSSFPGPFGSCLICLSGSSHTSPVEVHVGYVSSGPAYACQKSVWTLNGKLPLSQESSAITYDFLSPTLALWHIDCRTSVQMTEIQQSWDSGTAPNHLPHSLPCEVDSIQTSLEGDGPRISLRQAPKTFSWVKSNLRPSLALWIEPAEV